MDNRKTKEQLTEEIRQLKVKIDELKKSESKSKKADEELIVAKEKVEEGEKYLNNIINNIGDPIFVKDKQSRLLIVNDAFCNIFRLQRGEIIGKTLAEDVPQNEQDISLRIDKQVLMDGRENINEETLTVRDAKTLTVSTRKTRFIDDNGKKFLVGVIHDITKRKETEKELKDSEAKLSGFIKSATDGIVMYDSDMNLIEINNAALEIFPAGLSREELIGKHILEIAPSLKESGRYDKYLNVIKTGKSLLLHDFMPDPKFGNRYLMLKAFKVGQGLGIIFTDITGRKKAEEELSKHHEQLEELVKERTKELEDKNKELNNAMKVFVGRELTIRDLQNKIIALGGKGRSRNQD
ncbi:MAG: PAS domain S-box protein [Bacteroidetes bacterium]|jgi:PAS domain S-box-containing protein|nr:PAS domain S-box protein [Bacteroidota bacterium]MBT4402154.1 PAS domain S-box protein [Bacteroidota bacterium]MBT4408346.1 PAS domain S-box protein [Bacteroidota bacterium]MBT7463466.1 PAS domain S-box protein [Bacteroidota bacterium]